MSNFNPLILEAAGAYLGEKEWPGAKHNPVIAGFFAASDNAHVLDDETSWCAAFAGAVLAQIGLKGTGKLNARSYLDWGVPVEIRSAAPGDVVIFWRGNPTGWQGHVAFLVRFEGDKVIVRGGNQGDAVTDAPYPVSRILGIRRAVRDDESNRPTLRHGSKGPFVLDLQDRLARLGYTLGKRDGQFGKLTRDAVLAFQSDLDIPVDGVVGATTWAAIDAAPPREERAVDAADLRKRGSSTVANTDKIDLLAGGTAAVAAVSTVADAATEAEGALAVITRIITDHWPTLLVVGALVGVVLLSKAIRDARVRDARSGAHTGR